MSRPARRLRAVSTRLIPILLGLFVCACSSEATDPAAEPAVEAASEAAAAEHDHSAHAAPVSNGLPAKKGEKAARHPSERPIPAFEGTTLAGTRLAMRDLVGNRLVLFFFNPEVPTATPVAAAVKTISASAAENNFKIIGVGIGSSAATLSRYAKEQDLPFPVIDDSSGRISQQLRLQVPVALLGVDADGYVTFGLAGFPPEGDVEGSVREQLAEALHLSDPTAASDGALYAYPMAPELGVVSMEDGSTLSTEALGGNAAIVIFFLHTCPHCHHALEAIEKILESLPEDKQPKLVAISVQDAPGAVRKAMADLGLDYFTPYRDPGGHATDRWGVTGGVPVVTVLDSEGRIKHRSQGWNEKRDAGMLRMQVAAAAGARVPMLLDPKGYSGNDVCGVCHEQEYATWRYTNHSTAFATLVTHEADRRKDCIGCHVVGYEETGGYNFYSRPPHLENVGCESCHGRGGPHLSPDFVPAGDSDQERYASVCQSCHNPTHSLGFEFESFHPRVSHTGIAGMSNDERSVLLGGAGPSRELLPTKADYVGSDACQSCHSQEFETWSKSPHGHAVATLEKAGKAGESECLQCHTTAYGRPGGFPDGAPVASHPDLARVGCESCHGPGGDHVGDSAPRVGTILSLGDKCDSCVILKVCGTCHDDVNDPGFTFEVEERIEAQRHGTIESAATRAGKSAFHTHDPYDAHDTAGEGNGLETKARRSARDRALLRHALELSAHTTKSATKSATQSATEGAPGLTDGRG